MESIRPSMSPSGRDAGQSSMSLTEEEAAADGDLDDSTKSIFSLSFFLELCATLPIEYVAVSFVDTEDEGEKTSLA